MLILALWFSFARLTPLPFAVTIVAVVLIRSALPLVVVEDRNGSKRDHGLNTS